MSKISVIIPTYNCARYIKDAVISVINQRYKDWELIIVDDGSTDNTREVIAPYLENKRIRYVWQENRGKSVARNKGLDLATGKYITFLDADDFFLPGALSLRVNCLEKYKLKFVFSDYVMWNDPNIPYSSYVPVLKTHPLGKSDNQSNEMRLINLYEFVSKSLVRGLPLSVISVMFSSTLVKKYNIKFDDRLNIGQDINFWWSLILRTGIEKIGFIPKPTAVYRFYNASWKKAQGRERYNFIVDTEIYMLIKRYLGLNKFGKPMVYFLWNRYWLYSSFKYKLYFWIKLINLSPLKLRYWKLLIGLIIGRHRGIYSS
ncbi:glycosyltransferase family 2 protein [Desulfonauticus submarinus]